MNRDNKVCRRLLSAHCRGSLRLGSRINQSTTMLLILGIKGEINIIIFILILILNFLVPPHSVPELVFFVGKPSYLPQQELAGSINFINALL